MKILVCIKPVVDDWENIAIDDAHQWIRYTNNVIFRMNRYDEYALEEAVKIKEASSSVRVDVISVGPQNASDILRRALGKGADQAVHVITETKSYIPPRQIAGYIFEYAWSHHYDLILTGAMAEDDQQGLVGPFVSAMAKVPCASCVMACHLDNDLQKVFASCELEGGMTVEVEINLPAVLTIQSGINQPRYPSLSNMLRAKKQKITTIAAPSVQEQETEKIHRIDDFPQTNRCEMINGNAQQKADFLIHLFNQRSWLK